MGALKIIDNQIYHASLTFSFGKNQTVDCRQGADLSVCAWLLNGCVAMHVIDVAMGESVRYRATYDADDDRR